MDSCTNVFEASVPVECWPAARVSIFSRVQQLRNPFTCYFLHRLQNIICVLQINTTAENQNYRKTSSEIIWIGLHIYNDSKAWRIHF